MPGFTFFVSDYYLLTHNSVQFKLNFFEIDRRFVCNRTKKFLSFLEPIESIVANLRVVLVRLNDGIHTRKILPKNTCIFNFERTKEFINAYLRNQKIFKSGIPDMTSYGLFHN